MSSNEQGKQKEMNNINQMFTKRQTECEKMKRYIEMNESQWKIFIYSSSIVDNWNTPL